MTQHPNQPSASSAETSEDEAFVEQAPSWPWWVRVGAAIALAAAWIVIFAKPALGS